MLLQVRGMVVGAVVSVALSFIIIKVRSGGGEQCFGSEEQVPLYTFVPAMTDLLLWAWSAAGADDGHHAVAVDGHVADRFRPAEGIHRAAHTAGVAPCAVYAAGVDCHRLTVKHTVGSAPCKHARAGAGPCYRQSGSVRAVNAFLSGGSQ